MRFAILDGLIKLRSAAFIIRNTTDYCHSTLFPWNMYTTPKIQSHDHLYTVRKNPKNNEYTLTCTSHFYFILKSRK